MTKSIHPKLKMIEEATDALVHAAREAALLAAKLARDRRRTAYRALSPGQDTPLWNELQERIAAQFKRRGDQVLLARYVGVSRQRLHTIIKGRRALPDAERTLLLLSWVVARERGLEPS